MTHPFLISLLTLANPALAHTPVPSNQSLDLYASEVVANTEQGATLYLGFLAPQIAATENSITYEQVLADIDAICTELALPLAAEKAALDTPIKAVIIRLSDRPINYGETDPEAAQYMGFYDISAGDCAWQ
ncbi:MAG: hypothetical protein GY947_13960 [Rhodobacteraceae bacterium]|nr:hypothetical protein [Paracoccaceae bacterium]